MNWTVLLLGFVLAVAVGAVLVALLATLKPAWPKRRRILIAATFLPGVTLVATFALMILIWSAKPAVGGDMHDLALRAVAAYGAIFTATALAGGVAGVMLARMRRRA